MKKNVLIVVILLTTNLFFSQNINFADSNFKNALLNAYSTDLIGDQTFDFDADTNNDGEISMAEAEAVFGLRIYGENISSLSGIEHFTNLMYIDCSFNDISSLDLSNNIYLEEINCSDNNLSTLDLSNNIYLEEIMCSNNSISSLNISNNIVLEELICSQNNLSSLNIDNNSNLRQLFIDENLLTTINTDNNPNLVYLRCQDNQMTNLNLNNNVSLEFLFCGYNQILALDLTNNTNLRSLYCQENEITNIDVSNNTLLQTLHCWDNNINSLDISNCASLSNFYCNNNNLNSLNLTNNVLLEELNCGSNNIASLDISTNTNLLKFVCDSNQFNDLDISNNISLEELRCSNNSLSTLNIENNTNLISLYASNSNLTTLDFSNNIYLETVSVRDNQFINLDFNNNPNLFDLDIRGNTNLVSLFLKNGSDNDVTVSLGQELIAFQYICVDEFNISNIETQLNDSNITNVAVNTLCTFTPGGTFYTIEGQTAINLNNTGCNTNFPFLRLTYTDNNDSSINGSYITNSTGNFSASLQSGNYSFDVALENASFYSITPESINVNFPSQNSPFTQDICVTPNNTFNDLEVLIIPIEDAVPGFNSLYKVVYKNKGDSVISGSVSFTYDDDHLMTFVSANPSADTEISNTLTWNFTDLLPFENREIIVDFILNTPMDNPPLNDGDFLVFGAEINPTTNDIDPDNNTATIRQTVVNSFDPNDISCLEGNTITPDKVGEFVHYLIRFENTGTANATNVVLRDVLNTSMFDLSSLIPLEASHNFYTRIQNNNVVEFIFESIDLPFDDANNDGYILFKIRTLNALIEGDFFDNTAEIYFDFNFPIITNTAVTNIEAELSTEDLSERTLSIFPNPVKDELYINSRNSLQLISVYDISGRLITLKALKLSETETIINTAEFAKGTYFVKIITHYGEQTRKFVKG